MNLTKLLGLWRFFNVLTHVRFNLQKRKNRHIVTLHQMFNNQHLHKIWLMLSLALLHSLGQCHRTGSGNWSYDIQLLFLIYKYCNIVKLFKLNCESNKKKSFQICYFWLFIIDHWECCIYKNAKSNYKNDMCVRCACLVYEKYQNKLLMVHDIMIKIQVRLCK